LRDILKGMKKNIGLCSLILVVLLVAGCQGYEKVLKGNDFKLKYHEAMRYYKKEDYVRSATLFDQVAPVLRGTEQADTVYFYQALSYFKQEDYILGGHYFRIFAATYGGSPFVEEAEFMNAYCSYLMSPRPELDQSNTIDAIQSFQLFLIKYKNSSRADECKKYLLELREKLVEKSYLSAKLYFNLEDYKAAIVALNNSLIQYPDSKFREEILYLMVKSCYQFAYNSIPSKQKERYQNAIDEYYSFITEFPNSKYAKEVTKYFKNSSKNLGIDKNSTDVKLN
jgi:outer membrane protein assembly factor BamD